MHVFFSLDLVPKGLIWGRYPPIWTGGGGGARGKTREEMETDGDKEISLSGGRREGGERRRRLVQGREGSERRRRRGRRRQTERRRWGWAAAAVMGVRGGGWRSARVSGFGEDCREKRERLEITNEGKNRFCEFIGRPVQVNRFEWTGRL